MRSNTSTRARLMVLAALGAFAALVPTASADTALPVWTCRASAGYVELDPLLNARRIEPVLANGLPDREAPDRETCASQDTGVQDVDLPPAPGEPAISLEAASASTEIDPEIAAARDQTASATGGVAETVRIELPGLVVDAEAVTAEAEGRCVNGAPQLTAASTIASLTINGTTITIPQNGDPVDINLSPLIRVRLHQRVAEGNATTDDQALTQRAVHVELLSVPGGQPVARVVLGEAKVDRHGAVCAPPPPPPVCPAGTTPQAASNPLVCVMPVTAPCPAGSTADPNNGGACVIVQVVGPPPCPAGTTPDPNAAGACVRAATPPACPAGTTRDPASQACILVVQRPCPPGATADPATRVCVARPVNVVGSGENGRIGSATGPRATCGRIEMHFVVGGRRTLTSRFGTRVVTRGRLVTCGSNPRPIIGARVDVVHILPDGRRLRKTGLRSRSGGRLTLILPIDLRTRRIEFGYRPDLRATRVTSRATLRLTVRNRAGRIVR
ncbi:MAG TPA: choice-of-anchor P family protein [Solirubrobacteraceae bacterium]|nr:choice-of-anchor P family protein [Solirubrobacteraceae bacterium]